MNEQKSGCHICGKSANVNHHTSYFPEVTIIVCQSCHRKIHATEYFVELLPPKIDTIFIYGINVKLPQADYQGLEELIEANRYINIKSAIEHAIRNLLGKEGVAHCRYCGKMRILDTDGLCQPCARATEAIGT